MGLPKGYRWVCLMLVLSAVTVFAKDKERSAFLNKLQTAIRWQGYNDTVLTVTGKQKDVLLVWMPTANQDGMRGLKAQCIEPIRDDLKSRGFHGVEIRSGLVRFAPEWKWEISLDDTTERISGGK